MRDSNAVEFELVEPHFISVRLIGNLDAVRMSAIMDAVEDEIGEEPFFLLELLMEDLESLTPESRRVAAERLQQLPDRAVAVIGGNFQQNILAKLVLTAVTVLTRNTSNVAGFFQNADEAREWLRGYASRRDAN